MNMVLIDCGRWQVLATGVGVDPEDGDVAVYQEIPCVYDHQMDTSYAGISASNVVWNIIPDAVFVAGLRTAAGLAPRGDFYKRYLDSYATRVTA